MINLSYYLNLQSLCQAKIALFESFIRFAFETRAESELQENNPFKESFVRVTEDVMLSYTHKSGKSLMEVIYSLPPSETTNWMLPIVLNDYKPSKDADKIKVGKIVNEQPGIHPNAILTQSRPQKCLWFLSDISHYHDFRNHHITEKLLSPDCDSTFWVVRMPKLVLTSKALKEYKKLSRADKEMILADLQKLNNYACDNWDGGSFQVGHFSLSTGVDASDESDSTKNDPKLKEERRFALPNIGSKLCFLHIKISNTRRIHFYPDSTSKLIYVPYIGKHLKTVNYR